MISIETREPDLAALQTSLPQLLQAYALARDSVERRPAAWVVSEASKSSPVEAAAVDPGAAGSLRASRLVAARLFSRMASPICRWWYGFAIRQVTLFWIDAHIAGRTRRVEGVLRKVRLERATEMTPEIQSVDRLLMLMSYAAGVSVGYERALVLLRFVPLIGLLVTIGLIPLSVDASASGLRELGGLAQSAFGAVPLFVLLLNPLVVRFAFRWKRAVFMGGVVERRRGFDLDARYTGMGDQSIYALENRVFDDLGVKKGIELPVDLLLSPAVHLALNSTVGAVVGIATVIFVSPAEGTGLFSIIILPLVYWFVWQVWKRHKRRVAHGAAL